MPQPAFAEALGDRLPSNQEKAAAGQLRRIIAAHAGGTQILRLLEKEDGQPTEITLTPALSKLLMDLLQPVSRGDSVTLVPIGQRLTTQQAADILNVSRPWLIALLDKGEIPYERVGSHRRIRAEDLFAYKRIRDAQRKAALSDLLAIDGEDFWELDGRHG